MIVGFPFFKKNFGERVLDAYDLSLREMLILRSDMVL